MKTAPVRRHRRPAYPTRLEVLSDPGLLHRHVPPAWRAVPELAGAMALLVAVGTTSCKPGSKSPITAPLFVHGEGRGVAGCVVVAPPIFLSEEEAMQVIREETAPHGLMLSPQEWNVPGVKFAQRPGSVDAVDLKRKVAVQFISNRDYGELERAKMEERFLAFLRTVHWSSVREYDFQQMARFFARRVRQQARTKVYFGTLYDPATQLKPSVRERAANATSGEEALAAWENPRNEAKAESKRLLRLQVQDFVKWLQAQGAI